MVESSNKNDSDSIWSNYYKINSNKPPRDTLLKAITFFEQERPNADLNALDLGCGSGRDTKFLLAKNWSVLAIDGEPKGIELLIQETNNKYDNSKIQTKVKKFEELELTEKYDLVNSSFALPFCTPEKFPILWLKITTAIKTGGRFSGHFFGSRDTWSKYEDMNFHSNDELKALFKGFDFDYFLEEEKDGPSTSEKMKHWHVFHVVAKKTI